MITIKYDTVDHFNILNNALVFKQKNIWLDYSVQKQCAQSSSSLHSHHPFCQLPLSHLISKFYYSTTSFSLSSRCGLQCKSFGCLSILNLPTFKHRIATSVAIPNVCNVIIYDSYQMQRGTKKLLNRADWKNSLFLFGVVTAAKFETSSVDFVTF